MPHYVAESNAGISANPGAESIHEFFVGNFAFLTSKSGNSEFA
jgi:hypothetical protein